jgi:hypothetical protein
MYGKNSSGLRRYGTIIHSLTRRFTSGYQDGIRSGFLKERSLVIPNSGCELSIGERWKEILRVKGRRFTLHPALRAGFRHIVEGETYL